MNPILITQRQEYLEDRKESRDQLDVSFYDLFDSAIFALPNHMAKVRLILKTMKPRLLVLSGGGDAYEEDVRCDVEKFILDYASESNTPVLGICRGFQSINKYLGGSQVLVDRHVSLVHSVYTPERDYIDDVNSFHNFGVLKETLADMLEVVAVCEDGTIEAAQHRQKPWLGVMWHPERSAKKNPLIQAFMMEYC